ncbi:MAG: TrkH family potassium uptake protein [Maritimibacter sp.]|nr:TrkH family potassium uptake protein [Maritimibacter sp.]
MVSLLARLPLLVSLIAMGGLAMLVPAIHAAATGEREIAEVFFWFAALTLVGGMLIGIAMAGRTRGDHPRRHLAGLLVFFAAMPLLLALPFHEAVGNTSFFNAYFEMVSCLTTTGATLYEEAGRLAPPLHTWRATVGWLGGLVIWVGAIAVLAPMALGGFEVRRRVPGGDVVAIGYSQITERADLSRRIRTHAAALLPVYVALTMVLWFGLILAGDTPPVALAHAMSTLSTSGISPVGGLSSGGAGHAGEVMVAVFLFFAISRLTFAREGQGTGWSVLARDPEIRMATAIIVAVPLFLFIRHFIAAYEEEGAELALLDGLASLWGSVFTVISFLTTTGWASVAWGTSQDWSGLQTPGLILLGLALIGGGVATTAGGAKLLRVYALYKHGVRELERLVHPHSVGGSGGEARHLRRRGAYMAWLFFMLMSLSVALVMAAFSFTGEDFEQALVLAVAALTTTGPLAIHAEIEPIHYVDLTVSAKSVFAAAMIFGRLETLAIVALFSRELWRR